MRQKEKVKMKVDRLIIIVGISGIVIIEIYALYKGVNGRALSTSIGIVGGLVGFFIRDVKAKRDNKGG